MVQNCIDCRFAKWDRTAARPGGFPRLHPSGDGRCTYSPPEPLIARSQHWGIGIRGIVRTAPKPSGGFINRRAHEDRDCPVFQPKEK